MRKFLLTFAITSLIVGFSGCGKSASSTSDQVRQLCSQARNFYTQAADIISHTDLADNDGPATSEKIISLLDKAAQKANEAASVKNASEVAKAPAYALLAEINTMKASTLAYSARKLNIATSALLPKALALKNMVAEVEAEHGFLAELAKAADSDSNIKLSDIASNIRSEYETNQAEVIKKISATEQKLSTIKDQVKALAAKAEPIRRKGVEYRRKMVRIEGDKALEFDAMAGEAEKQYAEIQDKISALLLESHNSQKQLDIYKNTLESLRQTISAADAAMARLSGRSDLIASSLNEIADSGKTVRQQFKATSDEITSNFSDMSKAYTTAIEAYESASRHAKSSVRAIQDKASQARQIKSANSDSPMKDALSDMSARSVASDAVAVEADILLSAADLRRELLEKAMSISALVENHDSLLSDVDKLVKAADEGYQAAIEKYEKAASSLREADMWMLKNSQARTLWSRYKLSELIGKADVQYLHQAGEIVSAILMDNRDKPQYSTVIKVEELISTALQQ